MSDKSPRVHVRYGFHVGPIPDSVTDDRCACRMWLWADSTVEERNIQYFMWHMWSCWLTLALRGARLLTRCHQASCLSWQWWQIPVSVAYSFIDVVSRLCIQIWGFTLTACSYPMEFIWSNNEALTTGEMDKSLDNKVVLALCLRGTVGISESLGTYWIITGHSHFTAGSQEIGNGEKAINIAMRLVMAAVIKKFWYNYKTFAY